MANHSRAARQRWHVTVIVAIFTLAVAGAAYTGWRFARESTPHQGPIVLISVDGLRADRLVAYGAPRASTPAIDALAAEGVVFERAYAHSPQTLPSNAALLTGQLPFENGVRDDGGYALGDAARTIAEQLRSRGFNTGAAVSSFLLRRTTGIAQGFAYYDEVADGPDEDSEAVERDGITTVDAAERWLKTQTGQRYFLFVEVNAASADAVVGRIVDELKRAKRYAAATIVLTADHGDPSSGATLDDASLRVPFIVKQPGEAGGGRRVLQPVQHIDVLPTIVDLVRAPMPSGLRGRSLRAILDKTSGFVPDRPIYAEFVAPRLRFDGYPVFAVSSGPFRLVRGADDSVQRLVSDAPEPDAARVDLLKTTLDHLLASGINPPVPVAAADEDRLAASGYLPGLRPIAPTPAPTSDLDAPAEASATEATAGPTLEATDQEALTRAHHDAAVLVSRRQYAAALDRLRTIATKHRELPSVQYQVGLVLDRMGRMNDAARAFGVVASLRPDDSDVAVTLALALLGARRLDDATAQAAHAVELADAAGDSRAKATAHDAAARVAVARDDAETATAHALEAQMADPALPLPQFVRGRLAYDAGQYDSARAAFEGAARALKPPAQPMADLHLYLGNTLAHLDRYADAEVEFRAEMRAFPRHLAAYVSLATLYQASNRDEAVRQVIDNITDAAPTPDGYATAIRLLTIAGEKSRAAALRVEARRKFRGDPALALLSRAR